MLDLSNKDGIYRQIKINKQTLQNQVIQYLGCILKLTISQDSLSKYYNERELGRGEQAKRQGGRRQPFRREVDSEGHSSTLFKGRLPILDEPKEEELYQEKLYQNEPEEVMVTGNKKAAKHKITWNSDEIFTYIDRSDLKGLEGYLKQGGNFLNPKQGDEKATPFRYALTRFKNKMVDALVYYALVGQHEEACKQFSQEYDVYHYARLHRKYPDIQEYHKYKCEAVVGAVHEKRPTIINLILTYHNKYPLRAYIQAFEEAVRSGQDDICEIFSSNEQWHADKQMDAGTPKTRNVVLRMFQESVLQGRLNVVKSFYKNSVYIKSIQRRYIGDLEHLFLFIACYNKHLDICKYLIKQGADVGRPNNGRNNLQHGSYGLKTDPLGFTLGKSVWQLSRALDLGADEIIPRSWDDYFNVPEDLLKEYSTYKVYKICKAQGYEFQKGMRKYLEEETLQQYQKQYQNDKKYSSEEQQARFYTPYAVQEEIWQKNREEGQARVQQQRQRSKNRRTSKMKKVSYIRY